MKDENPDTKVPFWTKLAELPAVKGPVIGGGVMVAVTPFLTWTNHVLNGQSMQLFPLRNWMAGASSYATAALPCYAVTFTTMAACRKLLGEDAPKYELSSSFFSGALSGFASAPFEGLAQNMQLTKSTSACETANKMIAHNGYRSFFRGSGIIAAREGAWAWLYFSAIHNLIEDFLKKGYSEKQASLLASLLLAGGFGVVSTPSNQFRFKQQEGLTKPKEPQRYWQLAKDIWQQEPDASLQRRFRLFFKGAVPRAITTTVAAELIIDGGELYDRVVNTFKK